MVNVTPDSFSDGGAYLDPSRALQQAASLAAEGADIVEIGGESTRPGAEPVSADEEIRRIAPVVKAVRRELPSIPIALDTVKADVARLALDEGASIINDVSALRLDRAMAGVCAKHAAGLVLMHSRGDVADMASYRSAAYGQDVVGDVANELRDGVGRAERAGVQRNQIVLDPGLGFSKRTEHSVAVLTHLESLAALGYPIMIGASRKRFIGELSGVAEPASRVAGTIAANIAALMKGARLFRVHDVRPNREALTVAWNLLRHSADVA